MFANFLSYLAYFGASLALLVGGLALYMRVTPYRELDLIRAGNTAAAWSLSGAALGLALPIATAVVRADGFFGMIFWALTALVANLLVLVAVEKMLPDFRGAIENDSHAHGLTLGGLSLAVGVLNAAALT